MNHMHRLARSGTRLLVLAVVVLLGMPGRARAETPPVLFVHGYCFNAEQTWGAMFPLLQRGLFGEELIRLYQASGGDVLARDLPRSPHPLSFAIDFYNPEVGGSEGFSASAVAQVPIQRKASELKAVVDGVKRATGTSKVIVVAHDLGGLVARAYIEGIAQDQSGARISYGDAVASLITISTPYQGAPAAKCAAAFPGCASGNPVNKAEMLPGSSFLTELNNFDWDSDIGTPVHAVVSYNQGHDGDGLVSRDSQDLTRTRRYERSSFVSATELQCDARMERLHAMVVNEPTVIALVQSEVEKAGRAQAPSPWAVTCGAGATAIQVDANDDSDGVKSRIQVTLPSAGTYTIAATSFLTSARGAYTLALSRVTSTSAIGALSMEVPSAKRAAMEKEAAKRAAIKTHAAKQAVIKQSEENVK